MNREPQTPGMLRSIKGQGVIARVRHLGRRAPFAESGSPAMHGAQGWRRGLSRKHQILLFVLRLMERSQGALG